MSRILAIALIILATSPTFSQGPAAVERELLGYVAKVIRYGNYGGTPDGERLAKSNVELRTILLRRGQRGDVLRYSFPKLKGKMSVITSADGRLRIYSWDSQSGGTAHWHENVFQFRSGDGRVRTEAEEPRAEGDVCNGSYHQVFQTDTPGGRVYLAASASQCSTSLAQQTIQAFRIAGDKLDTAAKVIKTRSGVTSEISFTYDFFSVADRPARPVRLFSFNESTKTFRFPVVIRDRRTPQGRVTNRFISYRFDGKYFVKVS